MEHPLNYESNELPISIGKETVSSISLPPTLEEGGKCSQEQEDLSHYSLARDRQRRIIVPPSRYSNVDFVSFSPNDMNLLDIG